MGWERVPRSKFLKCFEMKGHIRTLRLDLMPLCNRLSFRPYGGVSVALIVRALLNLRTTIPFHSLPPAAKLVRLRLSLMS